MNGPDHALLELVLLEVRGLRADLAVLAPGRGARDQADRDLIPAIVQAVGGREFSARELLAHAGVDRALAAAIEATDILGARQLGKLLARLSRGPVDGFRLAKVDDSRDGIVWRVSRV